METEQAWQSIKANIDEILEMMEKSRRRAYKRGFIVGILLGIVVMVTMLYFDWSILISIICLFALLIITMLLILAFAFVRLDKRYKSDIMPILTSAVAPNAIYDVKSGVDLSSFFASMIFKQHTNEVLSCEDGIRGKINNVDFVFCEAHLSYAESTITNGKKNKKQIRHFDGMAYEATFEQMHKRNIIITTLSTIEGMDSTFEKQRTDGTAFSKIFSVYYSSQAEEVPLCEGLKQCFLNLYQVVKQTMGESDMTISFYQNRLLILIPSFRNRFEAKIFSRLKIERVKEDFSIINEIGNLTHTLSECA